MFELLGQVNLTLDTWPVLQACLESAIDLLAGDAMEAGRRYKPERWAFAWRTAFVDEEDAGLVGAEQWLLVCHY